MKPPSTINWRDRFLVQLRRRRWRGFLTLRKLLKPGALLHVRTRYGSEFLVEPGDEVDTHVIDEGFYESEVLDAVLPHLGPQSVLWVVGANFGLHAITAKRLYAQARVLAFEPAPAMAARILENSDLNGAEIELHAYALAGESAVSPFFINDAGNPGMSTLRPGSGHDFHRSISVATRRADEIIGDGLAPQPTALIVDAEGAELEILRGFGSCLSHRELRVIIFEAGNDFLPTGRPESLAAILRHAGFSWRQLERRERTAHGLSNFAAIRA